MRNGLFFCVLILSFSSPAAADPWRVELKGLSIEAPLKDLFTAVKDPRQSSPAQTVLQDKKERKYVAGKIAFSSQGKDYAIPVKVYARGQTSLQDCSFPKLRIRWEKKDLAATPLAGVDGWRINTHCADPKVSPNTEMGRVAGDRGPVREFFVYRVQELFGLHPLKNRLEEIRYKDTSGGRASSLTHQALILETGDDLGARLGGTVLEEEDLQTDDGTVAPRFGEFMEKERKKLHRIALFQTLILNADYGLRFPDLLGEEHFNRIVPPGFRNMFYLKQENSAGEVIPTDYDVSMFVTQETFGLDGLIKKEWLDCDYGPCFTYFTQLQKWRSFFSKDEWGEMKKEFVAKKPRLRALIAEETRLLPEERGYFLKAMNAFYQQLDRMFQVPVIVHPQVKVIADAAADIACGDENPEERIDMFLPRGTPAFVLETREKHLKVQVYDVRDGSMFNPLSSVDCLGETGVVFIRKKPGKELISTEWPANP